jgi:hypothetical protein
MQLLPRFGVAIEKNGDRALSRAGTDNRCADSLRASGHENNFSL